MLLAGHEWMVDWILFCTFTTIQSWCATNILEQLQMVQNLSIAHWQVTKLYFNCCCFLHHFMTVIKYYFSAF
ncbi:hypothetical protein PRUPE_3G131800 [Prunus persica]|nr:hypothetical protein PRUPE_3G131800 [Prunus persica]ONI16958.1 hypothetical protein PRUPE_3G131800 [Prunus persica]ONI16959.1 hypothetical protein PRUPE_3G131800 [Prunus persica]ONI16960.1 hypothetical protein PRUPE_3G131800 [Prunus persica]ONI16961.1 hypothetical protein PRUPE_3G131800 [Prunus persica]